MNLLDFRARFQTSLLNEDGGKYKKMLGFAHREVARNHEKSVKIRQLSLFIYMRKSPI